MAKCERRGQQRVKQEGLVLVEASGPDAIVTRTLKGERGQLIANVCLFCSDKLTKLGWK